LIQEAFRLWPLCQSLLGRQKRIEQRHMARRLASDKVFNWLSGHVHRQ